MRYVIVENVVFQVTGINNFIITSQAKIISVCLASALSILLSFIIYIASSHVINFKTAGRISLDKCLGTACRENVDSCEMYQSSRKIYSSCGVR